MAGKMVAPSLRFSPAIAFLRSSYSSLNQLLPFALFPAVQLYDPTISWSLRRADDHLVYVLDPIRDNCGDLPHDGLHPVVNLAQIGRGLVILGNDHVDGGLLPDLRLL